MFKLSFKYNQDQNDKINIFYILIMSSVYLHYIITILI